MCLAKKTTVLNSSRHPPAIICSRTLEDRLYRAISNPHDYSHPPPPPVWYLRVQQTSETTVSGARYLTRGDHVGEAILVGAIQL